ncbi:hypothetical protein ACIHCQ_32570 [Streptomyces sp. NPDC052236]|uniref:hypothetical protein n=1 Tax=Streptomyces sp. NPDC052236 TaxID=3365686 RepID=UPI0037CE8B3F
MNVHELDRQYRTHEGCVPPWAVALLVEYGHLDEFRHRAERGDWFCAHHLAKELAEQGKRDAALSVLAPFTDSGWWQAVKTTAGFLDRWGRTDDAITLVRPLAEAGDRLALEHLARLQAHMGRTDEVIALLGPGTEDWFLAKALVELTESCGREAEVADLLPLGLPAGNLTCSFAAPEGPLSYEPPACRQLGQAPSPWCSARQQRNSRTPLANRSGSVSWTVHPIGAGGGCDWAV